MARYGTLDYPQLTKGGFALGIALFVVGALGATMVDGPSTTHSLLVDAEAIGILVGLVSPFVFGILLPLTE